MYNEQGKVIKAGRDALSIARHGRGIEYTASHKRQLPARKPPLPHLLPARPAPVDPPVGLKMEEKICTAEEEATTDRRMCERGMYGMQSSIHPSIRNAKPRPTDSSSLQRPNSAFSLTCLRRCHAELTNQSHYHRHAVTDCPGVAR
jgi:hypothetical protein